MTSSTIQLADEAVQNLETKGFLADKLHDTYKSFQVFRMRVNISISFRKFRFWVIKYSSKFDQLDSKLISISLLEINVIIKVYKNVYRN